MTDPRRPGVQLSAAIQPCCGSLHVADELYPKSSMVSRTRHTRFQLTMDRFHKLNGETFAAASVARVEGPADMCSLDDPRFQPACPPWYRSS
jgi:hypothetical protein